ncbi:MAG: glycosyltransferase family 9 protein [Alphaproteobacteria bacterium]|nr:glycosyltransferase family 9 protein [Alphaproteobacteria bacterium]
MNVSKPESVLVYVGLDRVGDSLLKLPFVRGLRQAFPDAHITWLAGKETSVYATCMAPVVKGLIDEVIENAGIGLHPSELLRKPLGGRKFDLIIDSQKIMWASASLWRIPHKTFISPAGRFLLSSKKPARGYKFPKSMQRQLLDLLELASGEKFRTPNSLDLDPGDALQLLPQGPDYIGFVPGSGGKPKCWALENFIRLAAAQADQGRTPVFFLGPQEPEWLEPVRQQVPSALFPLQEKENCFDPLYTIALAGRLTASVSNDSGVGHMIALGGNPLVSLFGPTVPEKFMPMSDQLTIIEAKTFGGREMSLIPYQAVADALKVALQETGS